MREITESLLFIHDLRAEAKPEVFGGRFQLNKIVPIFLAGLRLCHRSFMKVKHIFTKFSEKYEKLEVVRHFNSGTVI